MLKEYNKVRINTSSMAAVLARGFTRRAALNRTMATYIGHDGMTNYSSINVPAEGTPSVKKTETPFLGSNLFMQFYEGFKRYGAQRTFVQAYTVLYHPALALYLIFI